jgi:alginate O-acetyltransferase complex protein AlgJ
MAKRHASFSESESLEDLLGTRVERSSAWILVGPFLLILFSVPLLQLGGLGMSAGPRDTGAAKAAPRRGAAFGFRILASIPSAETLRSWETRLENASGLRGLVQRNTQTFLTGVLGAGNSKVFVGDSGWLYYQPGLEFVTGPAITDPDALRRRRKKMVDKSLEAEPSPDPGPALLRLRSDLAARGIELVLFPVPDKVSMEPGHLGRRFEGSPSGLRPSNRGTESFVAGLRRQGIEVFALDPASVPEPGQRYLRADTHWTPPLMERAAADLAALIRRKVSLPAAASPSPWKVERELQSNGGDLLGMLRLPEDQKVFAPQEVVTHRVTTAADGRPWSASIGSEVVLLGDSFTNIYSDSSLGWGASAGFAEHLSLALGLPIDVVAINGGGADAARAEIAGPGGRERLERARVVVYEFADRDLTTENWKVIPIPPAPVRKAPFAESAPPAAGTPGEPERPVAPAAPVRPKAGARPTAVPTADILPTPVADPIVLRARVLQISPVPAPYSAPYADCLSTVRLEVLGVESGRWSDRYAIVVFLAMKENEWLPPASFTPGTLLKLRLVLFREAGPEIRSIRRVDDLDDLERIPYYAVKWEIE